VVCPAGTWQRGNPSPLVEEGNAKWRERGRSLCDFYTLHQLQSHNAMFHLHPQLAKDTLPIGRFKLCRLLFMNDSHYPWFILVPERENIREIHELTDADRRQLWDESAQLSRALVEAFKPDKLNIAALGNQVPQLHVHHIVRYMHDPAWPQPVWGKVPPRPYYSAEVTKLKTALLPRLGEKFIAE